MTTELSVPAAASEATMPVAPVPPAHPGEERPEQRIRRRTITLDGACALLGSAVGSFALTWLVYERVLPTTGALGFWVVTFFAFLALYIGVTALVWGLRAVADRLAGAVMVAVGLFIVFVVVDQVAYTVYRGHAALGHTNFYTQDSLNATATSELNQGGVFEAIVGSLEQMGIATAISVPLGVLTALYLVEVGGRGAQVVRVLIQSMTSLPEIIAGLFIYAIILLNVGLRQSGIATAFALTIMMMPFVARSSEVMLRLVPHNLREASYALGASQWRTVWTVVLPTARSGLTTAVVLGMARAIGETAPVLLTNGLSVYTNTNAFNNWQTSLPLYIWQMVREPSDVQHVRAFGAAVVLMAMVLVLFTIARVLGGKAPGELTRRQRRRVAKDRLAYAAARAEAAAVASAAAITAPVAPDPQTTTGRSAGDQEGEAHESA
jgi:phosphate transport system permease protein